MQKKTSITLDLEYNEASSGQGTIDVTSRVKDADGRVRQTHVHETGGSIAAVASALARNTVFPQVMAQLVRFELEASTADNDYFGKSAAALKRMGTKALRKLADDNDVDLTNVPEQASALHLRSVIINAAEGAKA